MGFSKGKFGGDGTELLFFFLILVLIWPFFGGFLGFNANE